MNYNYTNYPHGIIISRTEFLNLFPTQITDSSEFYYAEKGIPECGWFVCCSGIYTTEDYWIWCVDNLKGYVRCFSSNTNVPFEWWGFTERDDVFYWMLRWI